MDHPRGRLCDSHALGINDTRISTVLGFIMQITSLVLGIALWRSAKPTEKKNGMAITIIWLVISGLGFMIGLVGSKRHVVLIPTRFWLRQRRVLFMWVRSLFLISYKESQMNTESLDLDHSLGS